MQKLQNVNWWKWKCCGWKTGLGWEPEACLGISAGPPASLPLGHLLKKFSKTQHDNNWMKLSWISSPALSFKDPESPSLCYITFMKGGYCLFLSGKQTLDLSASLPAHSCDDPTIQEWLMTASSPLPSLYQGAQGLACPTASISLGTAVTDLL